MEGRQVQPVKNTSLRHHFTHIVFYIYFFIFFIYYISESIIAFAWEPNGSKFAVLHGESPRISVSFYHVKNNGKIEILSE